MYQETFVGMLVKVSTGETIPRDPGNRAYQEFLRWEAAGGVAMPYVPPQPTPEQIEVNSTKVDAAIVALQGMSLVDIRNYVDNLFPQLTAQQRQFLYVCGATAKWVAKRL